MDFTGKFSVGDTAIFIGFGYKERGRQYGEVTLATPHRVEVKVGRRAFKFRLRDGYTSGYIGDRSGYRLVGVKRANEETPMFREVKQLWA